MRSVIPLVTAFLLFGCLASVARAERVWEGYIHLVDCRMQLHFAGYTYGNMSDLDSVEIKTGRSGGMHEAVFIIVPDEDNALQATFSGRIRVHVDGHSVQTNKLRLVRRMRHSKTWKIHRDDIKQLVEASKKKAQSKKPAQE